MQTVKTLKSIYLSVSYIRKHAPKRVSHHTNTLSRYNNVHQDQTKVTIYHSLVRGQNIYFKITL